MKIQNWLIYNLAKSVLFFASVLCLVIVPVEAIGLVSGKTLSFNTADGIIFYSDGLPSFYDRIMLYLPGILITLTVGYACWQFAKILNSIEKNKEFSDKNYKRLFNAAGWIISIDLLLLVFDVMNHSVVRGALHISPATSPGLTSDENSFSLTWLVVGCILMILSKVFRRGSELQEDHDLSY
jgi:hypothetical protein